MPRQTKIIALCGKGGVGKTSVSALMIRCLHGQGKKVLAIDADPAKGLALALHFQGHKTIDDIRTQFVASLKKNSKRASPKEILADLDYEVLSALEERDNLAFLALGRPEQDGCYCQVNQLLKQIISSLAENFDLIIIDGEAGLEQINRRVMEKVTHLLLVSDLSYKGLQVARAIREIAKDLMDYQACGLLLNKIKNSSDLSKARIPQDIKILGTLGEDGQVHEYDLSGQDFLTLPQGPLTDQMGRIMKNFGL